jgi:propionate CoA-transferase
MSKPIEEKICSAPVALELIEDGATIATGGFVGSGVPEVLLKSLETRFLNTGRPKGLTLVYAAGQGDGKNRGVNHLAYEGLIRCVVGGHWGLAPKLGKLASEGKIEAYNFPQGVISQIFRDIAAGRPGCITHIGMGTFIDPINQGGRLNEGTPQRFVKRIDLDGQTWLWYRAFPIHVGLIRATAADIYGNLLMDRETIFGEVLPIAQAVYNSGGRVIAQVNGIIDTPAPPQQVKVPGILVQRVVLAEVDEHEQTFSEKYNEGYCTAMPDTVKIGTGLKPLPPGAQRIISARACDEIPEGAVANLGIGMPEGIARIAAERNLLHKFTLTVESGPIGGIPAGGLSFGASLYPQAVIDQPSQFDFYDGGGLDFAALGMAQVDQEGNVNVSKYGAKLSGVGGFVNISQTAKRVVFCGRFSASGLKVKLAKGRIRILREGKIQKFVERVEQMSFSAERALKVGQKILYVTERAVFRLTPNGLELVEVAPGIDIKTQVLDLMAFKPIMRRVGLMPEGLFYMDEG